MEYDFGVAIIATNIRKMVNLRTTKTNLGH